MAIELTNESLKYCKKPTGNWQTRYLYGSHSVIDLKKKTKQNRSASSNHNNNNKDYEYCTMLVKWCVRDTQLTQEQQRTSLT